MMRMPAVAMAEHLMWTRHGYVTATWRLDGLSYGFRPDKDKALARGLHQALLRALPGESLLLGLRAGIDPAAIVSRMMAGVDLDANPDWASECLATLDSLEEIPLGQRTYWLTVPLRPAGWLSRIHQYGRAATTSLTGALGLPRPPIRLEEVNAYAEAADQIETDLPTSFRPRRATPAQQVWLATHAQRRGLYLDTDLPTADSPHLVAGTALPEPLVDEGGQTDLHGPADPGRLKLPSRRFVKVSAPDLAELDEPTYQAMLVLADVPPAGMTFPGSEFLGRIDESGIDADWAIRMRQRSSTQAAQSNRRALRSFNEQLSQREGEISAHTNQLRRIGDSLAEYLAVLESDKSEVEIQATVIMAVAAPSADEATTKAKLLTNYFAAADYRLIRPIGFQSHLWWSMVPGTPHQRALGDFTQITTSRALSAAVPVVSAALGDAHGIRIGRNICAPSMPGIVLLDPEGTIEADASGSMAVCGDLGAGKSALLKTIAGGIVDRGGRLFCIDQSKSGEWATFAQTVTDAVVVDTIDPAYSLDPLTLFGPAAGGRVTQSFLTALLRIGTTTPQGVLLSEVLDPEYLRTHRLSRIGEVMAHLRDDCTIPGAYELARLMSVYASKDLGRVIFDASLPPFPTDATAVVVRTHTLELPTKTELENEHLYEQMPLEKPLARALYTQLANLAEQICCGQHTSLGAFLCDEFHHISSSPEGRRVAERFIIQGRKEKAVLLAGSPRADHFGDETLRGLFPTRVVTRTTDRTAAKQHLRWLDVTPTEDLVDMLCEETSPKDGVTEVVPLERRGECFLRDSRGNIGRAKVDLPARPERAEACKTTPGARVTVTASDGVADSSPTPGEG